MNLHITPEELLKLSVRQLFWGEYETTDAFRSIEKHTSVCFEDGTLVATTGVAGDRESLLYAAMFADAPAMLMEIAKLRDIAEKAATLANAWKAARKFCSDCLLEQGDPANIDLVADSVLDALSDL